MCPGGFSAGPCSVIVVPVADQKGRLEETMSSESVVHPTGSSRTAAYLRLFRIPNLFTAWADILMGFLVVHQGFTPLQPLVFLLIASACIYTAGMVLNVALARRRN